jgi:excisionase family DNA binding protein
MTETLLTTKEVLERLGISRPTLYALIERGEIKPVEDNKPFLRKRVRLLFREEDIEQLLKGKE